MTSNVKPVNFRILETSRTHEASLRWPPFPQSASQGYLAHKKQPYPLGPPWDLRFSLTVGSWEEGVFYESDTPAVGEHIVGVPGPEFGVASVWVIHAMIQL